MRVGARGGGPVDFAEPWEAASAPGFRGLQRRKLDPGLIMEQVKVQIAVANAQELLQVRAGRGGVRD